MMMMMAMMMVMAPMMMTIECTNFVPRITIMNLLKHILSQVLARPDQAPQTWHSSWRKSALTEQRKSNRFGVSSPIVST